MNDDLALPIPSELLDRIKELLRDVLREELSRLAPLKEGFLDVNGAANYLATTPQAIRALVKRDAIPHHKAPNGRLLFDRDELHGWARSR